MMDLPEFPECHSDPGTLHARRRTDATLWHHHCTHLLPFIVCIPAAFTAVVGLTCGVMHFIFLFIHLFFCFVLHEHHFPLHAL